MDSSVKLCVIFFTAIISGSWANFSDCGSAVGSITSVTITNCQSSDAQCILHRNTNVSITIAFVPSEDVQEVKVVVHGVILGVEVPFALPNPDGCKDSGLTCPLSKGGAYTYQTIFPILQKYPRVNVGIKFELQNQNTDDITCSLIPSKIQ